MNTLKYMGLLIILVLSMASIQAQDSANLVLTLERTACFGACPVYTVSILENGTVIYNGENFVEVTGDQTSEILPETAALMVKAFEDAGYFDWDEAYNTQTVSDLPTVTTSVTRGGKTHRISRYVGDSTAPLALSFLEQWIDQMVNTQLWTGIESDISGVSNGMETPLITLQRGACFGACPTYSIAAYEDGTIVYMGNANVENIGVHVFQTDKDAITSAAQSARIFGYFNWHDNYEEFIMTDQATVITSVRGEDDFKRIVRYEGDMNAPIGLIRIEGVIDQLVADLID